MSELHFDTCFQLYNRLWQLSAEKQFTSQVLQFTRIYILRSYKLAPAVVGRQDERKQTSHKCRVAENLWTSPQSATARHQHSGIRLLDIALSATSPILTINTSTQISCTSYHQNISRWSDNWLSVSMTLVWAFWPMKLSTPDKCLLQRLTCFTPVTLPVVSSFWLSSGDTGEGRRVPNSSGNGLHVAACTRDAFTGYIS